MTTDSTGPIKPINTPHPAGSAGPSVPKNQDAKRNHVDQSNVIKTIQGKGVENRANQESMGKIKPSSERYPTNSRLITQLAYRNGIIGENDKGAAKISDHDITRKTKKSYTDFISQDTLTPEEKEVLGDTHKFVVLSGVDLYIANYPISHNQMVGQGSQSKIYEVTAFHAELSANRAIKHVAMAMKLICHTPSEDDSQAPSQSIQHEVDILTELHQAGVNVQQVPKFIFDYTFEGENQVGHLSHLYEGNLEQLIMGDKELSLEKRGDIVKNLLQEACKISDAGIIHGDYKMKNVLFETIDGQTLAVFGDFAGAKRVSELETNSDFGTCTPGHFTYQDIENHERDEAELLNAIEQEDPQAISIAKQNLRESFMKRDVFALGTTIFKTLTKNQPYQISRMAPYYAEEQSFKRKALEKIDPVISSLILRMIAKNPAERPSFDEIHSIIETVDDFILPEIVNENEVQVLCDMLKLSTQSEQKTERGKKHRSGSNSTSPTNLFADFRVSTLSPGQYSTESGERRTPSEKIEIRPRTNTENSHRAILQGRTTPSLIIKLPDDNTGKIGEGVFSKFFRVRSVDEQGKESPLGFKRVKNKEEIGFSYSVAAESDIINEREKLIELKALGLEFILQPSELIHIENEDDTIIGYFIPLFDGNLKQLLPLVPTEAKQGIAKELLSQLYQMNQKNVGHFDIKPENILLKQDKETGSWCVAIGDWGPSHVFDNKTEKDCWKVFTTGYFTYEDTAATRMVTTEELAASTMRRDMFAMGTSLYKLFLDQEPYSFRGEGPFRFPDKAKLSKEEAISQMMEKGADRAIAELIVKMIAMNPLERPKASEIASVL